MNTKYPDLSNTFFYDAYWFNFQMRDNYSAPSTPLGNTNMRTYYFLFELIDGKYHFAFGDYNKDLVKDEAACLDNKTKLVRGWDEETDINEILADLNK